MSISFAQKPKPEWSKCCDKFEIQIFQMVQFHIWACGMCVWVRCLYLQWRRHCCHISQGKSFFVSFNISLMHYNNNNGNQTNDTWKTNSGKKKTNPKANTTHNRIESDASNTSTHTDCSGDGKMVGIPRGNKTKEKVKPNNLFETKRHCVAELVAVRSLTVFFSFLQFISNSKREKQIREFSEYSHRTNADVWMQSTVFNDANFFSFNVHICKFLNFAKWKLLPRPNNNLGKASGGFLFSHSYHVCLTICSRKTFNVRTVAFCHRVRLLILTIVRIINVIIECWRLAYFLFFTFFLRKENLSTRCFGRKLYRTKSMRFQASSSKAWKNAVKFV